MVMVVEVTTSCRSTDHRIRAEKPAAYAQAGIPVYLVIDRERREVTAHSDPLDGRYRASLPTPYGDPLALPPRSPSPCPPRPCAATCAEQPGSSGCIDSRP
ncbi:Uma2 family endonuclease [Kitasatospora sp. MMS16-BH015]|uniref:Uma2 family endonuclease n=1 Tax=Kitasatospora sp. MMS16-BH015 TaxID=2018025 RepID=UPI000CF1F2FB